MERIERTQEELKIALAILSISSFRYNFRQRIISAYDLILYWRKAPRYYFVEALKGRVKSGAPFELLHDIEARVEDIKLTPLSRKAEFFLSGIFIPEISISVLVRRSEFKKVVEASVLVPGELICDSEIIELQDEKVSDFEGVHARSVLLNEIENCSEFYTRYPIFFGTDRLLESSRTVRFGGLRCDNQNISYGIADVSVPEVHTEGRLERPLFGRHTRKGNPNKHIVIHDADLLDVDAWLSKAKDYLNEMGMSGDYRKREGLLFIHGYNVSFNEALWRSAQFCHDLSFPGLMLCFSWASLGTARGYAADESTIDWSASNLKSYLTHVTEKLGLSAIHVVAHSMGNRALLTVLESWENKPGSTPISQVVLAAPDVDCDRFKQFARVFNEYEQVTLYASRYDRAIVASQLVHSYPRAGGANPPLVFDCLSTIDVSNSAGEMFGLGHSYVAEASKVFRDLFYVIRHRHKPHERVGVRKRDEGYWELI